MADNLPGSTPAPATPENTEFKVDDLPEDAQNYIRSLRREAGDRRVAAKEAKTQAETLAAELAEFRKAKEAQAAEQGKFQDLYEAEKKKTEEFALYRTKAEAFETYFQEQLDASLQGVDPEIADLVRTSPKPVHEKLEMAKKFRAGTGSEGAAPAGGNSPAASRPGAGISGGKGLVEQYHAAKTAGERASLLTKLKAEAPKVYATLMNQ